MGWRGAVHEEITVFLEDARPVGQELPAFFLGLALFAGRFQLATRPKDGSLRWRIEPVGIEHRALIVVAEQDNLALHHQVDALARVRAVADDVAQAIDVGNIVALYVLQDGLKRLEVAVDVAYQGLQNGSPGDRA